MILLFLKKFIAKTTSLKKLKMSYDLQNGGVEQLRNCSCKAATAVQAVSNTLVA
jgi:hypothetical protein